MISFESRKDYEIENHMATALAALESLPMKIATLYLRNKIFNAFKDCSLTEKSL